MNLIPSPKRVKDSGYLAEDGCERPVDVSVERVTLYCDARGYSEHAQDGRVRLLRGVQREQGHRIVGVESAVMALTERIAELERDNRRLRGTMSVESPAELIDSSGLSRSKARMEEMEMEMEEMEMEEMEEMEMEEMETEMEIMEIKALWIDRWLRKMETVFNIRKHSWECDGLPNTSRLQDAIRIANQLMDKKLQGYVARSAENKRRMESNLRDNLDSKRSKRQISSGQNVARALGWEQ
ncbi:hypothetical protein Tco_1033194 [Tanacetum coccineum]|uniref:Uncharacterized protein n=1 Tax=Tanacetum coccineum TaxID=301880 RepID=A0ABQ5GEX0_9ASTR